MILGGWTLVVLAAAGQGYIYGTMRGGERSPFWRTLLWPAIYWYGWALLTPLLFTLARRFPLHGPRRGGHLALLALGSVAAYALHVALQVAAMVLPTYRTVHDGFADALAHHASTSVQTNLFAYWIIIGAWHAADAYRKYRGRELQAAHLEAQLTKAQLQALRMQLHPHFLFNTLHAIAALMYRDVRAADRMLGQLGELLRLGLDRTDAQLIPLADEVDFVARYLQIEQARFEDRLAVTIDVAPEVREALVPGFVLQPFVENAVKHGIAPRSGPGRIEIRAREEEGRLRLCVRDDGPGLKAPLTEGVGLANTRARLGHLYGDAYRLTLRDGRPGLLVDLVLPLSPQGTAPAPPAGGPA